MHMQKLLPVILLALATPSTIHGQPFENGFSFNLPWNDTTTTPFFPEFPSEPITSDDFVTVDTLGNFLVEGEPYRFFGVNLTTQAAFPKKEDAAFVAGRMRKFGINLVRFHHIDNPWSNGSLFYGVEGTRQFNADLLDRLEYLIYQLKQHGIYVNMNLNVSRTFEPIDGVISADSLSDFGKGVTLFDSTMIALQKEYARMLLTHENPYTGMPLAEDPVLAMVETINENSLYRMWYSESLKPISEGGKLPVYYSDMLDGLWNDYLIKKYESTDSLKTVWDKNLLSGDTLFFDGFENGKNPDWKLELHESANAVFKLTNDAATGDSATIIEVSTLSAETWHTMFKYVGETTKKDSIYEVHFKAKSDNPKSLMINFQRDISPWTYYQGFKFQLDTSYKNFKASFKAPEDNIENLRISFTFDHQLGNFYIDDFVFKTESNTGLKEDESLETKSVKRIPARQIMAFTKERVMDMTAFYADIQMDFLTQMKTYLNDSLGVTAPVTGTNWFTGPEDVYVQNVMDYIDNHAYWDHPQFPNQPWSPTDWKINNTPMLTSSSGTIENLFSGLMVKNKPYTVSEYNHAFPNQYQSELLTVITSYLSFNDADGLMLFPYSGTWDWSTDLVNSFFDIHRNTSLMGSYPLYSYVFRNRLLQPAKKALTINYSKNDVLQMAYSAENWWSAHVPYDKNLAYSQRIEILFDNDLDFNKQELPKATSSPFSLNEDELYWNKQGIFKINTPRFSSICGYLNNFAGEQTDMLTLVMSSDFGSVNWLSLSDSSLDKSTLSLLSIGTKMMNTNMQWDGTTTVHNNWGTPPSLVYPLELKLRLKTTYPALVCYPLNQLGNMVSTNADTLLTGADGYVNVDLNQKTDQTIWYGLKGIELKDDTVTVHQQNNKQNRLRIYPVPATNQISIDIGRPVKNVHVFIYDMKGNQLIKQTNEAPLRLSVGDLQNGIYYCRVISEDILETKKIIINK